MGLNPVLEKCLKSQWKCILESLFYAVLLDEDKPDQEKIFADWWK